MALNYEYDLGVFWFLVYKTLRSTRELIKSVEEQRSFSSGALLLLSGRKLGLARRRSRSLKNSVMPSHFH